MLICHGADVRTNNGVEGWRSRFQYTLHCTVKSAVGVFYANFVNRDAKSVRYRTVLCA